MGDNREFFQQLQDPKPEHYDAIVVGSGITGGWAAKELCEKGLRTLVLERGRNVEHVKDYTTAFMNPWQFPHRLGNCLKDKEENPVQSTVYNEGSKYFYVSDKEHPYIQEKPFHWIRGYQVGGRSLTWGRQCYRLSDLDFEANLRDGHGVDWPIRYRDIAPWYDYVEQFVGISGKAEGLAHLPDGLFLPPMELNCIENHFASEIRKQYKDRIVTNGRVANLTRGWNGRGPCQYRNLCDRGCPFSGYFSSNGATLPAAAQTGNLHLLPDTIVTEVLYDKEKKRASGVRVMNQHTREFREYFARVIFLNASTVATAALLLNSRSDQFPEGLGNSSGQIGHNLMDHFLGAGATGEFEGYQEDYLYGRKPNGIYIPRFRNISSDSASRHFVRGYGFQGNGSRREWRDLSANTPGFGLGYKEAIFKPGPWTLWIGAWGETLPYFNNRIKLDPDLKDQWGLPMVSIHFEYHDNEHAMIRDVQDTASEMLERTGFKKVNSYYSGFPGGSAVHEMGTIRMGRDPKTSVLNAYNQMHDVPNVFITDGSCMTSAGCQNPSLTYMALTARACDYAVEELKKRNL
jgi:choline dehydrogenase-like flavoprotein